MLSFRWHNYESVFWIMHQQEMLVLVIEGRVLKSRDYKTLIVLWVHIKLVPI